MGETKSTAFTSACSVNRRCPLLLLSAVTSVVIVACSQALQVTLFNDTSDPITLHVTMGYGLVQKHRNIVIGSQLPARFDYRNRLLHMSAAGCELTYMLPHTLQGYPFPRYASDNFSVKAQIEPDLAIYLVPPDTKAVANVGLYASLQVQGFPLRPSSRTCRDAEPKS